MSTEILRDSQGRMIGKITQTSNIKIEIRDSAGRYRGCYNPSSNETRDNTGRLVGKGNLLTMLLN